MRAVLLASGYDLAFEPVVRDCPVPLVTVAGRPFVHFVIEDLVQRGIRTIDFVLSHRPELIEHELGDGSRWGCRFVYHLARDEGDVIDRVRALARGWTEPRVLLGSADVLPFRPAPCEQDEGPNDDVTTLFVVPERPAEPGAVEWTEWLDWAWLPTDSLVSAPRGADLESLLAHVQGARPSGSVRVVPVDQVLSVRSPGEVLASNRAILEGRFEGLLLPGSEAEPGIRIGRNVSIHPTAQIQGPVIIGEDCSIGRNACVGPLASIGDNCILDEKTTVADSILTPGTYAGEGLEIRESLVRHNRLVNVPMQIGLTLTNDFILGELGRGSVGRWLLARAEQATAGILALLLLPLIIVAGIALRIGRPGPVIQRARAVRLPADADPHTWRDFTIPSFARSRQGRGGTATRAERLVRALRLEALPSLFAIARGHLHFVGLPPRSREQIKSLPNDWQSIYIRGRAGLFTVADAVLGDDPSPDELHLCEAYHVAHSSLRENASVLLKALLRSRRQPMQDTKMPLIIAGFQADYQRRIARVLDEIRQDEVPRETEEKARTWSRLFHQLKGSSGMLGFPNLQEKAAHCERICRDLTSAPHEEATRVELRNSVKSIASELEGDLVSVLDDGPGDGIPTESGGPR